MVRRLLAASAITMIGLLTGCGLCQDCLDWTGPVPHSQNYGEFPHSPRSGSASTAEGQLMEEEYVPVSPVPEQ